MNKYLAELLGTFALVFAGCGAIVSESLSNGQVGVLGIGMVFGLVVMAMIYSVGNISGAHLNPAVTIGFVVAGRMEARKMLPYIGSQLAGALIAGLLLRLIFWEQVDLGVTHPSIHWAGAFAFEVVISFLLMFVILNVTTDHMEKGIMAGAAIGATVAMAATFGGPVTGASMNPARSLAPALFSNDVRFLWLYLVAPILGAMLAAPSCRLIQGEDCCGDEGCNPEVSAEQLKTIDE